ncbi:Flp pilus assembly pilin Flp [Lipingzhangella halophila]|uniref:Flp pilus assembly pilin Flp n=1 Tax=Lipingzhangella halophila TaxID=1783352 RepID=A0A7W7RCB3_9ACTN|nr:Hint domain-containing protein [Lipingzhangella halophila]MBB4929357.1 Flp pilus assembly pilin Flp [Lipingzhangella halophila]
MWRAEAGAGKVEYGAVILLVAAVTAAVIGFGLPGDVRALLDRSMCLVPGDQECEEAAAGDPDEDSGGDDESGDGEDEPGGGEESGDGGDGSEDEDGESGDGGEESGNENYDPELAEDLEEAESDLEDAEEELEEAESSYDEVFEELLQLLKELIGLQDAEDCLTEGDIVACIWTVVGFAPWGKAAKVAKKIPAIARLVTKWRRRSGRLDDAEEAADNARGSRDEALEACGLEPGGRNSFPADTPVLLAGGGTQAIADIDTGDYVVAADPETGTTAPRPVTDTITSFGDKELVTLTVLTDEGGEEITATGHHRFWDKEDREWVQADSLRPGDQLRAPDGGAVTVAGLNEFTQRQTVHNLTVHDLHTYYVSAGGTSVLVHNQNNGNGPCDPPGSSTPRTNPEHVEELKNNGVKFSEEDLVSTARRTSDDQVVFLENGNSRAGLQHILGEHSDDFARRGISENEVPDLVTKAASEGRQVGTQGRGNGRPIYEVEFNGETHRVAVTVGSNGFIVGANPAS